MSVSDVIIWALPHSLAHALLLLLIGLLMLAYGGKQIVPATITLGTSWRINPTIIAIIVVAGGTSAPELFVSLQATFASSTGIALGNVIGSNMANMLLVVGLSVWFSDFALRAHKATKNSLVMLGATLIISISLLVFGAITWPIGVLLLAGTAIYIYYLTTLETDMLSEDDIPSPTSATRALLSVGAAILFLLLGADMVVTGGVIFAKKAGLSEAMIGLSIIAIGTSLPEIVAVIASVMQKRHDIALGNIIGSNIFNLGIILGLASLISPLPKGDDISALTIIVFCLTAVILTYLIWARITLKRPIAIVFVGFYFAFLNLQF